MRSDGDHMALKMQPALCSIPIGCIFPVSSLESWTGPSTCPWERPWIGVAPRGWALPQNVFCSASIRPGLARDRQDAFTLAPSSSAIYTLQSGILLHALLFCLCLGAHKASGLLVKTLTIWPSCLGQTSLPL